MNRLRSLGCVSLLVRDAGRRLSIDWRPSPECGAGWPDLFVAAGPEAAFGREGAARRRVDLYGVDGAGGRDPPLRLRFPNSSSVHINDQGRQAGTLDAVYPATLILGNSYDADDLLVQWRHHAPPPSHPGVTPTDTFYVQSTGLFRPLHLSCQEFLLRRSAFYRNLEPVRWIGDAVDDFYAQHFLGHMVIGVHVRSHEEGMDWEVVPGADGKLATFDEGAPVEAFVRPLQQVLGKYPNAKLFVASNSAAAKATLAAEFPGAVLQFTPTIAALDAARAHMGLSGDAGDAGRSSRLGVGLALVDWLLLSKTALIVGTFYSSFSEEAALVNLIPRVIVRQGALLGGLSLDADGCGYKLYEDDAAVAAYARKHRKGGTERHPPGFTPARMVAFNPCPQYERVWGISDVFC